MSQTKSKHENRLSTMSLFHYNIVYCYVGASLIVINNFVALVYSILMAQL